MLGTVACENLGHVRCATFPLDVFFGMTFHTQVHGLLDQLLDVIREMRVVTGHAFFRGLQASVLDFIVLNFSLLVVMAHVAEPLIGFGNEIVLEIGAMRAVTVDAGLGNRCVCMLFGLGQFLFVGVTGVADIIPLRDQHFGEVTLVGIVARATAAFGNRRMYEFFTYQFGLIVADKAEVVSCSPELELVGRLMRVVTASAFSIFDRWMNAFTVILTDVALVTETAYITYRLKLVLAGLFMAVGTFTDCCWSVHELGFAHLVMAA